LLKTGEIIEIQIDRLATGGHGVGRYEGFVIFVPYSAPGDTVRVAISEIKKNFAYAEIKEIINASASRVTPKCKYYGLCGGCNWQHLSYSEQLKQKQAIVDWAFKNLIASRPIIPSPKEWNYRRRVQLHQENSRIGFLKRNAYEVVPTASCEIAREELLANWPKPSPELGQKFELGVDEENKIYIDPLKGHSPEFTQVNIEQNKNLQRLVAEFAKKINSKNLYDLYCGSGNFAFAIAQETTSIQVIGVDVDHRLIQKANEKSKKLNLNLEFLAQRDDKIKGEINFSDSTVVLDPPRAGCSPQLIEKLLQDRPEGIIYVSCHPQTAARDMKILTTKYALEELVPLDMFPQTDHIEVVGLLR